MSTSYTRFNIQDLPSQDNPAETDLLEVAVDTGSGYATKKASISDVGEKIVSGIEWQTELTETTNKTIAGAINEVMSAKADITSLATVATSGAYADLSGKPTIDTALDTTSMNAVENRAVASEINSIKSDITVDGSASGDIATFVDGSANPLKELTISIVATQSGTGDPSPTNVRPITGWTGANISTRGFNLWDEVWENGAIDGSNGSTYSNDGKIRSKNFISIMPNKKYYIKSPSILNYAWYDINKNYISGDNSASPNYARTAPSNAYFFKFSINVSAYNNNICINISSSKNGTYKPYDSNSETINIDWQSEAGTVYGGNIKPLTGELIVTHDYIASYNGETINEPWISSMDVYSAGATPTKGAQVVYPLTAPITYQLTPTEIRSLLGVNNVWANCGAITELKYTRDLNLCINDIIARIEALESGSSNRSLSVSPMLAKSLTSELGTAEGKTEETEEETKEEAQNER